MTEPPKLRIGDRVRCTTTTDPFIDYGVPSPQLVETDHGDEWMYIHHSLDGREANE